MSVESANSPMMPYIAVQNAAGAIDFYKDVFEAKEETRLTGPDGRIGYAELHFGPARLAVSDEHPEFGAISPATLGGSPVRLLLEVESADETTDRAVAAGATLLRAVADQFHGHRLGMIADPFGHVWIISTNKEQLPTAEVERRFHLMFEGKE